MARRPRDATVPGPDQESVWDYPRPPRIERSAALVRVELAGTVVAQTAASWRVLETSHPPVHYLPLASFAVPLTVTGRTSFCEWKGVASYLDVGDRAEAGWTYPSHPQLAGHVAVYPSRMDACWLDGERVVAQEGDFYGGWITSKVVGPFKGAPGTRLW